MARTLIRLGQITGSFGTNGGQINDTLSADGGANLAAIGLTSGSMVSIMSEMASAIKRLNGADTFAKSDAGVFGHTLKSDTDSTDDLGADGTAWRKLYVDDIDLNGQGRIDLDADADTSIRSSADDVITFEAGGSDVLSLSATVLYPESDDGIALGSANKNFSDLFIADAGVINLGDDQDVTITHDGSNGVDIVAAGGLDLSSTAGSATLTVVDGQTVTIGKASHNSIVVSPHGTAGNELMLIQNVSGTTDGADQAGAIELDAQAGGIGIAWADDKDLWMEGGQAIITANHDTAESIKLHADAGSSQTIHLVNDAGTSATEGAAAIQLLASAGGVNIKGNLDGANAVLLTADGGTSATMVMHNDQGTADASIKIISDAGGVTISGGSTTHGVKIGDVSGAPVTIGHTTSEVTVSDNLIVGGDLIVQGTTTTVSSSNLNIQDSIIGLGVSGSDGPGDWSTTGDKGIIFARGAATDRLAGMWWDGTNFTFAKSATSPHSGSFGTIVAGEYSTLETGDLDPGESNTYALGSTSLMWSDLFLGSGAVVNFNNGDVTLTHSANLLDIDGGSTRVDKLEIDSANDYIDVDTDLKLVAAADIVLDPAGSDVKVDGNVVPNSDDGGTLGSANLNWSDAFFADAAVLNFGDDQDVTLTHVHNAGLLLSSGDYLSFGAAGEYIAGDGTDLDVVSSGKLKFDYGSAADSNLSVSVAGTNVLVITASAGNAILSSSVDDKDIIFHGNDATEVFRVDGSANALLVGSSKELRFGAEQEYISGDGSTLSIVSEDGSIEIGAALADGQTLKLGKNGAVETIIAPHGTAGNEKYSVTNTAGTAVMSDGNSDAALQLAAVAGGIGIRSTANLAGSIQIEADGGTSETIVIKADQSAVDGADGAGAIQITADAGGISLNAANTKDLYAQAGQIVMKAKHNTASAISIETDAGTDATVGITNVLGNGAQAILVSAEAGGVKLNAGLDGDATAIHLDSASGITIAGGDQNDDVYIENSPLKLESITAPSTTTNKLYAVSGDLFWDGNPIGAPKKGILKATTGIAADTAIATDASTSGISKLNSSDTIDLASPSIADTFAGRGRSIDVFVNGQLMVSGSAAEVTAATSDYRFATTGSLKLAFALEQGDVIQILQK